MPRLKSKLIHNRHSGRLRPHEHTSYFSLAALLLVVGLALVASTVYAEHPAAQSSSVSLSGIMPGKAPTIAATIKSPASQQHFTTSPVTLSGTCPQNTLVELFKNDIFAGSSACTDAGIYSIDVDLLNGQNTIVAKVYDALNQPGPDSSPITLYYDVLPNQSGPVAPLNIGNQLLLNTDAVFRGAFPQQSLDIPIDVIGGTAPFALNVQFGDSNNKVISHADNSTVDASHVYQKPGTYQVSVQASDAAGHVAFLSVAAIVNGQPSTAVGNTSTSVPTINKLLVLWPLYAASVAVIISFYIGERREKQVLTKAAY